ncbi:hypothetical protein F6X40_09540 [Paraburkholderia sp. UCT31]|uniref:hypothetical protein n=1 Tax=Paraburkholderia sp. UCT31 TaxID=2615209 RepID=UPI00165585B2|nr:hypothetical protein [Paraburkholderia sp. UCT31]MBC8737051.1 hypothetical protein [Paraburkholderia sp. UCT31]
MPSTPSQLENSRSSERLLAVAGDADLSQRSSHLDWSADKVVASFLKSDGAERFSNYPAAPAPTSSTPFYRLDDASEVANPELANLKQTTVELVRAGFIDQKDIDGLSARLQDTHEVTPADKRHEEAAQATTTSAHNALTAAEAKVHATLTISGYVDVARAINMNEEQTSEIAADALGEKGALKAAFLHELGHATLPADKLMKEVFDSVKESGQHLPAAEAARLRAATEPHSRADDLSTLVKEMYADAFSTSATYVVSGTKDAEKVIGAFQDARAREYGQTLSAVHAEHGSDTFVENHHTTEMLNILDQKFKSGEAQKAIDSGHAHEMLIDVVAKGYVREYENTRFSDLNVHHIENGKLESGLPQGVTREQVLLEDARHPMAGPEMSAMTVLVPTETVKGMDGKGVQFASPEQHDGLRVVYPAHATENIPGFSLVSPGGLNFTVEDKASHATLEAFQGSSGVARYLDIHTLAKADIGESRPGGDTPAADRGSDKGAERREESADAHAREAKSAAREQAAMEPSM